MYQSKQRPFVFDSLDERYEKTVNSVKNFAITQLGITAFKWDKSKSKYTVDCIDAYLFRRSIPGQKFKHNIFSSEPESLEFLSNNNFDFNKWIYDGKPGV